MATAGDGHNARAGFAAFAHWLSGPWTGVRDDVLLERSAARVFDGLGSYRFLSRFEYKYFVDPLAVPELRQFIRLFAVPDRHAAKREGHRYPICSLYLDTEDLRFYVQTVSGAKNRFKLRLRTYSDDPSDLVFFEIKERMNNVVRKWRLAMGREDTRNFMTHGVNGWLDSFSPTLLAEIEHFASHMNLASAKPVMRVKYVREAYETTGSNPVRITLDTNLEHAVTFDDNVKLGDGSWVSTPIEGTILEVKFTERFPPWVNTLAQVAELRQQSIPKYGMCVDHLIEKGGGTALSLAGFCLPPHWA